MKAMKLTLRAAVVVMSMSYLCGASCFGDEGSPDAGVDDRRAVASNCGFADSQGNAIGIGQYCAETADCPVASDGTTIQCSTVLTDNTLPLLCSRICGGLDGGAIDCGQSATCHNIVELGFDLTVCVPWACDPLFDAGVPRQ